MIKYLTISNMDRARGETSTEVRELEWVEMPKQHLNTSNLTTNNSLNILKQLLYKHLHQLIRMYLLISKLLNPQ